MEGDFHTDIRHFGLKPQDQIKTEKDYQDLILERERGELLDWCERYKASFTPEEEDKLQKVEEAAKGFLIGKVRG